MIPNHTCRPSARRACTAALIAVATHVTAIHAAETLLQEGFNTDGSKANPARYTFTGKDLFEVPRIQSELNNYDQKGPLFWGHNFEVSYVGNPVIPARRMIFTWRAGADTSTATESLLKVWDSSVTWLLEGKKNARIVVSPNAASIGGLADRLTAAGHTVVDDDTSVLDEQDVVGDLMIHGPGAPNASRFVLVPKPVIVMNNPDYDDMLVGSIGSAATFAPGKVTIAAPGHPAAGGQTGSFDAFTSDQSFELVGSFLPPGATTLATVTRIVPPAIGNLADVEAVIAGTKANQKTDGTVTELDFSEGTPGSWPNDNPIPGGYTGNWGLEARGKLSVAAAGTYRFAVGSDDGSRLRIDLDRNGLTTADYVLDDPGPHGHQVFYADATFPAAGQYDYDVRSYNSGGGGSLEVSVALAAGSVADDALDSGLWEVLSTTGASPVKLQAAAAVTAYTAVGPNVEVQTPIAVLLNGPNDTPKGAFFDGGALTGFEGTGFIGAAGLNKWAYPDGQSYRSVRLAPVNVAGKPKVKVTVALAATVVDFETSDFVHVVVYPNGTGSTPVVLGQFEGVQNAIQPWLADRKDNFVRRLTKQFADFTFDVPAGATDLVVEIRMATTWWTEIAAVDNIRVTSGDLTTTTPVQLTAARNLGGVKLDWTGGNAPFLVQFKPDLGSAWADLLTTSDRSAIIPLAGAAGFFRITDGTTKTVKLMRATLEAAQEPDKPASPASGAGMVSISGNNLNYYVSYDALTTGISAAHIHAGARGAAGAPFIFFTPVAGSTSGSMSGSFSLSDAQKTSVESGGTYFNLHTARFGGGEIRGQIEP